MAQYWAVVHAKSIWWPKEHKLGMNQQCDIANTDAVPRLYQSKYNDKIKGLSFLLYSALVTPHLEY